MNKIREIVLIVDDEEPIRKLLYLALSNEGYACLTSTTGAEALSILLEQHIDLVLLDLSLPDKSGVEILSEIKSQGIDTAVIMVTGNSDANTAMRCVRLGAYDYVTKPFTLEVIALSARRALEKRSLEHKIIEYQATLEQRINDRSKELAHAVARLKSASIDTVIRLSRAAEYKDGDTSSHILRVSRYSTIIAERLNLSPSEIEGILYASMMHDIGKIGVPDKILLKPGRLDEAEWESMKQHTTIGFGILDGADSDIVRLGASIALNHHEKWDGTGYPFGLKGEVIPLPARIVSLADVLDALTSRRVYRKVYFTPSEALKVIEQSVERQFDPSVFAALRAGWNEILSEAERFRDSNKGQDGGFVKDTPLSELPDFQALLNDLDLTKE
ncbi:Response regulator containing a CheY-like receiver domain and an HD-GYP domain [Dehalogenimonas alkenigignens]|uniref:Response regulator containing a CheY-like receiver domain and an HD-GYP domain n=1 Tax=Dehalogenimonas alkenigignens TaxID=1217799 RepID=A0A0W0GFT8_9CHLR|nr:HD domain-containing phosphohydrolase [Dehalogenimonas alkenigignens]KTB47424.1 Response regulator containing a CheY-like receiver domain and an HD-GYP domain [Dehalogenimonas alkenigignens]